MHKKKLLLVFAVLVLAAMACSVGSSAPQPTYTPLPTYTAPAVEAPPPTPTDLPPDLPTPTESPVSQLPVFVENNNGEHPYQVEAVEGACPLTDPEPNQTRVFTFEDGSLTLYNPHSDNTESYDQINELRYMRINSAGRPVVVEFTEFGYMLQVYNEGVDVEEEGPCSYFKFTLQDQ